MQNEKRLKIKNSFDGNLVYGAKDFNKATGRDIHVKNRENNIINKFSDPNTGKLRTDLSKERTCPICRYDDKILLFNKDGFDHFQCKNCSLVYVNPILKDEILHNHYLNDESYHNVLTNETEIYLDKIRFNYCLNIIESYTKIGSILDIGAGPGIFVEVAKERGWHPVAVEFNKYCTKRIESLGIQCFDKPIEKIQIDEESFNCITLWAVLEHLQNPKKILKEIYKLLKPNGVLLILVPNVDSLASRIMHQDCGTFGGDTHINFFNKDTLVNIQKLCGFKTLEIETVFSEINTISNYLNYNHPYLGDNKGFNFEFLNPKYIHENYLGYCLVSYSKKLI